MHGLFKTILLVLVGMSTTLIWSQNRAFEVSGKPAAHSESPQGTDEPLYGGSYALLIGVSDYTHGWSDLEMIPKELAEVGDALKERGFKVEMVRDPDADEMQRAFTEFINAYGYGKKNRLLFFFSGHGFTLEDRGYIVPANAPDPIKDEKGFTRTALPMTQITAWCRQITAKHALFLFDSCFSGTIFKSRSAIQRTQFINNVTAKPVRQFITSGSAGQEVPAKSVFTPHFVRALRGAADHNGDNYVTGTELGQYLKETVLNYGQGQDPQYGTIQDVSLNEGDFVFFVPGKYRPQASSNERIEGGIITEYGSLKLASLGGGTLYLDGKEKGKLGRGSFKSDKVPIGRYHVEIQAPGFVTVKEYVTVEADKLLVRNYDPRPDDGTIVIDTDEGEVLANGPRRGQDWLLPAPEMVFKPIPSGSFTMGSPENEAKRVPDETQHRVRLSKYFWLGQHEVTQAQWQAVMGNNPSKFQGANLPVESVSWIDVEEFCEKLTQQEQAAGRLPTGYVYRLPTEAEWEYACRAGSKGPFHARTPARVAWYKGVSGGKTHPVGEKKPNAWGLHDMHGNVSEWCFDSYASYGGEATDPYGSGPKPVYRGGGFNSIINYCRSASRARISAEFTYEELGFRVALAPDPDL